MAAARKKGKWIGGRVPLGYRVEGGKLVIHEDEAVLVRELFRVYQEEKSLVATADVLNARGWRTKKCITKTGKHTGGLRWDKGSVHRQLTNQIYVGKVDFQDQIYEGEHEAIIDEQTFARVQQLLKSLAPDASGDRRCRLDFLLRGLLRCRVCSSAMTPRWSTSRGREYRYYVCTRVSSSGRQACSVRSVPAEYPPDEPRIVGGRVGGQAGRHEQSNEPALDRGTSKAGPLGSGARRTEHHRAGA